MRVALIYNKECECTIGIFIEKVIKNAGIACTHFWTKDSHTIPKEFDLYSRIDHGDYKYDTPKDLHPCVFYVIDTHLKKPYKRIRKQVGHFDIIFCAHRDSGYQLGRKAKVDIQ